MVTPEEGKARLLRAAESGALDEVCRRHGVRVLTVFGSAGRGEPGPGDLDVGVSFEPGVRPDVLGLATDLHDVAGREVDLGVVDGAAPLFRDRALMHATPVWESRPHEWINSAVEAHMTALDTAWLRRLDLDRLAGR
ncbi:nucleotidyltransferase family protein [Aquipuribacter nitratireducens]|uniref:Nucleotidyltransferase family protein n=1 Tax=Aquipuribacter nitratireducens TaxID=650104 RepID=A0ABW0GSU7_9MICO